MIGDLECGYMVAPISWQARSRLEQAAKIKNWEMRSQVHFQALAVKLTPLARKDLPSITPSGGCYVVAEPTRRTNDVMLSL